MVQGEAAGVLGDHDEGGAAHGALDAEPRGEPLDEARLARAEVTAEGDDRARRGVSGDPAASARVASALGHVTVTDLRAGAGPAAPRNRSSRAIRLEDPTDRRREAFGHVSRDEAGSAARLRREVAGQSVEVHRRAQRDDGRHALGRESARVPP